jgi:hypothetical protein
MATIQAFYFIKGGSASFNCNSVNPTDKLQCEALISFSGIELGVQWWVNWRIMRSDGYVIATQTVYALATSLTTFQSPLLNLPPGTYTVTGIAYGRV